MIPGKNLQRAVGPLTYLRDKVGGQGAELLTQKGKLVVAAKANLRPFRAPLGRAIEILSEPQENLEGEVSSDSDSDGEMSDE